MFDRLIWIVVIVVVTLFNSEYPLPLTPFPPLALLRCPSLLDFLSFFLFLFTPIPTRPCLVAVDLIIENLVGSFFYFSFSVFLFSTLSSFPLLSGSLARLHRHYSISVDTSGVEETTRGNSRTSPVILPIFPTFAVLSCQHLAGLPATFFAVDQLFCLPALDRVCYFFYLSGCCTASSMTLPQPISH